MDYINYVYNEIRKFSENIIIDGSFGNADFAKLITLYPKLVAYIESYTISKAGLLSGKTKISIKYKNKGVLYTNIYDIYDEKSAMRAFRLTLIRFDETMVCLFKDKKTFDLVYSTPFISNIVGEFPYLRGLSHNGLSDILIGTGRAHYVEFKILYHIPASKLKEQERIVDQEVARIGRLLFEPTMPKEVKVLLAHNYLCDLATYDPKYHKAIVTGALKNAPKGTLIDPYSHLAYGALINHVCVCHGYSDAFRRILSFGGVTCETIRGYVDGLPHAWNIVRLDDGKYYHVDVTFDDQTTLSFNYFMKNDAFMKTNRIWEEADYPKCDGVKNVLAIANSYIRLNQSRLISKGIKPSLFKTN